MEIKIGIGLDDIIFGMNQKNILSILGRPDKIDTSCSDSLGIFYKYKKLKIECEFHKEDGYCLFTIEIYNENAKLFGEKIIGKSKSFIIELLKKNNINDLEYTFTEYENSEEDEDESEEMESDENNIIFEFKKNILKNVSISPLFIDDDTVNWPSIKK